MLLTCQGPWCILLVENSGIQMETAMDPRMQRGLVIAAMVKLTGKGGSWQVPSQSCEKVYTVDPVGQTCTCPDHQEWHHKCKHIFAVEITIKREISADGQTITETKSITFTE